MRCIVISINCGIFHETTEIFISELSGDVFTKQLFRSVFAIDAMDFLMRVYSYVSIRDLRSIFRITPLAICINKYTSMFKQFKLFTAVFQSLYIILLQNQLVRFNLIILSNMDLTNGLINDRNYSIMCFKTFSSINWNTVCIT